MLRIHRVVPLSWFHPEGARILAARLARRAVKRMDKGGLFLTLTYDREQWGGPRELYEDSRDKRHVRHFLRRLEKYLGASLRGQWLRKMEFHRDKSGWIHWHVLLDWRSRIPHEVLAKLWGFGHVWVSKATKSRVAYTCKYVAKSIGDLPGWLLGEPSRSVRMVHVSPGFWDGVDEVEVGRELLGDEEEGGGEEEVRVDVRRQKWPAYVTIGQMIERMGRERVAVEAWDNFFGEWRCDCHLFNLGMGQVAQVLAVHGRSMVIGEGGVATVCSGDLNDDILADLASVEWANGDGVQGACEEDEEGTGGGGREAAPPPLHLTKNSQAGRGMRWLLPFWLSTGDMVDERAVAA